MHTVSCSSINIIELENNQGGRKIILMEFNVNDEHVAITFVLHHLYLIVYRHWLMINYSY